MLKQQVLLSDKVKEALSDEDVVAFAVDTTVAGSPGKQKLDTYKATGIPFIVVEGPGLDKPMTNTFPGIDWVVNAIRKAQGKQPDAVLTSG